MISTVNDELRNLFQGDYLTCRACGQIIFSSRPGQTTFFFRDVTWNYHSHLRRCFGLKRLVVRERNVDKLLISPLAPK